MIQRMECLSYEEKLRFGVVQPGEEMWVVFEYLKGAIRKIEKNFLIGPIAVREVVAVLN